MMGKMTKDFMRIAIVVYLVFAFVDLDLGWVSAATGLARLAYAFIVIMFFMIAQAGGEK